MQEYRWDALHGRWVIIAAKRAWRPGATPASEESQAASADCPFCPGHEAETPKPLYVEQAAGLREDEPWRIRVVPNLYEAVSLSLGSPEPPPAPEAFAVWPARGMHEVIIETPRHGEALTAMPAEQLAAVFLAFQVRIQAAHAAGLAAAVVFKNAGRAAGASLAHPHTQMIALPFVPAVLAREAEVLRRDDCFLCQSIAEKEQGNRVVFETAHFQVGSPLAGAFPYETILLPKAHRANFYELDQIALLELAGALQRIWRATETVLGPVPMNYVLHTAPFAKEADFHWHFEIIPRLTRLAGFELGTGSFINPSSPEESATKLRAALED